MSLLGKIPFIPIALMFLLWQGYQYYQFENNPAYPKVSKEQEIAAQETELTRLQAEIQKAKAFEKSLDERRQKLSQLQEELSSIKLSIGESIELPIFIKEVVTEAKKLGITVTSYKPGPRKTLDFYNEQEFIFDIKGIYVQVMVFMERLSKLSRLIKVDDYALKPISSQTSKYVELQSQLVLKAFFYQKSKEDDIGRKAP